MSFLLPVKLLPKAEAGLALRSRSTIVLLVAFQTSYIEASHLKEYVVLKTLIT